MNILTQSNIKTMSSLEIAAITNKKHAHVMRDIRTMMQQIANPNLDYEQYQALSDDMGRTSEIRLGKDLTITLVTGYSAKIRYDVVMRWQELEQQAQASQPVIELPKDYLSALKALVSSEEEKQVIGEQLSVAAPKAAALDVISHVKGALGIREVAKTVGIPEREFVNRCLNKDKPVSSRFLYRDDNGKLNAYSHRIKQGFMSQKITSYQGRNGHNFVTIQVKFTAAGVAHIAKLMQVKPVKKLRVLEAV